MIDVVNNDSFIKNCCIMESMADKHTMNYLNTDFNEMFKYHTKIKEMCVIVEISL